MTLREIAQKIADAHCLPVVVDADLADGSLLLIHHNCAMAFRGTRTPGVYISPVDEVAKGQFWTDYNRPKAS